MTNLAAPTHRFYNHSTAFGLVRSTKDNVDMDLNGDNTANAQWIA
jgi:hypothetical protein